MWQCNKNVTIIYKNFMLNFHTDSMQNNTLYFLNLLILDLFTLIYPMIGLQFIILYLISYIITNSPRFREQIMITDNRQVDCYYFLLFLQMFISYFDINYPVFNIPCFTKKDYKYFVYYKN